jgi:hypothetical protein
VSVGKSTDTFSPLCGGWIQAVMKSQNLRVEIISDILFTRKTSILEILETVPQSDTGEQVEYTKVAG